MAISTAPGRGGIGVVRLAGPQAVAIAARILLLRAPLEHARATFARVLDPADSEKTIDEAVVTAFFAPHSYTGGEVVEIAAHGSPVVLRAIVEHALTLGARAAHAGEFTQRAFLSGRLDLTQAEAVHDLIAAQTLEQARVAARQLGGAMSRRVAPAKEDLLHLIALLEAGMDFASGELDDVDVVAPAAIADSIAKVRAPLVELAASFRRGQLLRDGASLALIGRPNAGKSSLFNRLLGRNRAIVTATPGTTRDTVEESAAVGGIPVRLIDTAGLRLDDEPAADEAEQIGMVRSREALADADLVLVVVDASTGTEQDAHDLAAAVAGRPHLLIRNKIDLVDPAIDLAAVDLAAVDLAVARGAAWGIETSALTGEGIETLRAAILHELQAEGALAEAGALNTVRQQEAVVAAVAALDAAAEANGTGLPHEVLLMDLHAARHAADSLTGATTADDILGRIFSTFCIGK